MEKKEISSMAGHQSFEEFARESFDFKKAFSKPEPLKGYRVLSCTQYILGPAAANYLAELGAEVIKIELPRRGEPMRHTTPFNEPSLYPLSKRMPDKGTGLGFFGANANEYFISIDFHKPEGQELVRKLAAKSDVIVENYRPGTFDRWGIGPRQLMKINPRLIYCWLGGFGGWGPGRTRASYDILGQSQGGAFGMTGEPAERGGYPSKHTIWLADYWGGMMGIKSVMAALYYRETVSGKGTMIEYSQVHGVTRQLEYAMPLFGRHHVVRERWGGWDTQLCPHGIVKCGKPSYPDSDNPQEMEEGYTVVSAYKDEDFAKLCDVIGDGKMKKKYAKHDDRVALEGQREIYAWLEGWAADKTKEQVFDILTEQNGINTQPAWSSKEVATNPHWQQRGAVRWIDDPYFGDLLHQGPAFMLSETPPRTKWAFKPVGVDNEAILSSLAGLNASELAQLEEEAII